MASKPKHTKPKTLEELLEDTKIKKDALKKIIHKISTNTNHKSK